MAAADIAKSTQASVGATASSAAGSMPAAGSRPGGLGPGASARPASKRFCSGFMALPVGIYCEGLVLLQVQDHM